MAMLASIAKIKSAVFTAHPSYPSVSIPIFICGYMCTPVLMYLYFAGTARTAAAYPIIQWQCTTSIAWRA